MELTSKLMAGEAIDADTAMWLKMLAGFDVIYTAVSLALIDVVLVG